VEKAKISPFAIARTAALAFCRHFVNQNKLKLFIFTLAGLARRGSSMTALITAFRTGKNIMSNKPTKIRRHSQVGIKSMLLGLLVLLSGCDLLNVGPMTNSDVVLECPPVSILSDAALITRYIKGAGKDIIDIDFTGKIIGIKGKCFYEFGSDTGKGTVEIDVITKFKMERGAANKSRQADFQYFVSIVDGEGNILEKQTFSFSGKYLKNRFSVKEADSPIKLSIPLAGGKTGQDFTVYVGFQLSNEELEFNRNQSAQ
jgi:hypothetical protein